jgi:hypothetical protein
MSQVKFEAVILGGKTAGLSWIGLTSLREASRHSRLLEESQRAMAREANKKSEIREHLTVAYSLSSHVNRTRNIADYPWAGGSRISHPQMCSQSELNGPLNLSYPQDAINNLLFRLLFLLLLVF